MSLLRPLTLLLATLATTTTATTGVLLPLYVYPSATFNDGAANWRPALAAISASPSTPYLAVINPGNGPGATGSPGNADANYITGVSQLNAAPNVKTIGYVRTNYGTSSTSELYANLTTWSSWSSYTETDLSVAGIFFDEAPTDNYEYLSSAISHARSAFGTQQITTICNFGTAAAAEFYSICDVAIVFEGYLNNPGSPTYAGAATYTANTPAGYLAQAAVVVHHFTGSAADGRVADTALLGSYVQEAEADGLGWVYFCSADYDSITAAPATVGALAAAF